MNYFTELLNRHRKYQKREQEKAEEDAEVQRQIAEQNDLYLVTLSNQKGSE